MTPMPKPTTLNFGPGLTTRVVDTGGDGVPVVLLHGLAASLEAWRDTLPGFAHRRVLAFDLPGFGEASKPDDADYTAKGFFLPQLHSILDALDIHQADVVGSSMGASLALRYAYRHPERVHRMVLAAPGGFASYIHPFLRVPTTPFIGRIMSRPQRATNAFAMRLVLANPEARTRALLDETDRFSKLPGAHNAFVTTLKGLTTLGGLKDLDEFEAEARAVNATHGDQVLLLWGDKDRIFPIHQLEAARAEMPSAQTHVIPGAGHFPQIDAPDAFNAVASDFLR